MKERCECGFTRVTLCPVHLVTIGVLPVLLVFLAVVVVSAIR